MPGDDRGPARFDEQAALEELERLQRALEESRRRRKDATAAFDDFVSSFPKRSDGAVDPPPRPDPRRLSSVAQPLVELSARSPVARKPRVPAGVLAGAAVALIAGVALIRVWWGSPSAPEAPTAGSRPPAVGIPISTAAQSTSGKPAAGGIEAELIALRRVWVRAIVDGERAFERELQADARVPLRAVRTIVIRAGDAGAVRLSIDGRDQGVLGRDGMVATRTFTVK